MMMIEQQDDQTYGRSGNIYQDNRKQQFYIIINIKNIIELRDHYPEKGELVGQNYPPGFRIVLVLDADTGNFIPQMSYARIISGHLYNDCRSLFFLEPV